MNEAIQKGSEKRLSETAKEKFQYALTIGVITMMLWAIGFPFFIVLFFGVFAFLIWKVSSFPASKEVRDVFEFYLKANEILRDDERRWFGFEIKEVINQGEEILQIFPDAPPLLYFTLGALYHKLGDYKSAVQKLSKVAERNDLELSYMTPSSELRRYVKILRKIESDPAEAPQTSAAIRALERARRNRTSSLLAESFLKLEEEKKQKELVMLMQKEPLKTDTEEDKEQSYKISSRLNPSWRDDATSSKEESRPNETERKPISEVLHDIYD
jgi:tetratricopeptide (TPR) repeat protein